MNMWPLGVVCVVSAIQAGAAAQPEAKPPEAEQPGQEGEAPGQTERIESCNLSLVLPPGKWTRSELRKEEGAIAQWTKPGGILLAVRREALSPGTPNRSQAFEDVLLYTFGTSNERCTLVEERDQTVGGIAGRRFRCDLKTKGGELRVDVWCGVVNGFAYRVVTQGPRARSLWIGADMDKALATIATLDPDQKSPGVATPVTSPLKAGRTGVTLRWPETMTFESRPSAVGTLAGGGAGLAEGNWTYLTAQTIHVGPLEIADKEILAAIEHRMTLTGCDPWTLKEEASGVRRWTTKRAGPAAPRAMNAHACVFIRGGAVTMVRLWSIRSDLTPADLSQVLEQCTIEDLPAAPTPPAELTEGEREAHAVVLNSVALSRAKENPGGAAEAFKLAAKYEISPTLVDNAFDVLMELGQLREALAMIDASPLPPDHKLVPAWLAREARLRVKIGDLAGAADVFASYFATGKRDDELLGEYLDVLESQKKAEEVLTAIDTLTSGDPAPFRFRKATALAALDKLPEAVELLRVAADAQPTDWGAVASYLDLLLDHDRYAEVEAECRQRLTAAPERVSLLARLGRAEMGLRWFARARDTFDKALKLLPGNETLTEELAAATRALGQGDRTLIATGIEPVAIPAEFTTASATAPQDANVVVEFIAHAIRFEPGKVHRVTRVVRDLAVTRSGVDELSTFEVPFNPAFERVCVNSMKVIDPKGEAANVDPASFYVTDAQAGDASSGKVLVVPATGLAPGGRVELVTTIETISPAETLEFANFRFAARRPVAKRLVWVSASPALIGSKVFGDVQAFPREDGVAFVAENIRPFQPEPGVAHSVEWDRHVLIGPRGASWEKVGRDYLAMIAPCTSAEIPQSIKDAVAKHDQPDAPLADRVRRLCAFVQRELTYRFIAFGPRAYIPRAPGTPLAERSGDCKDHSALLWAMLNHAGIPAHLALYSTQFPPTDEIADLGVFDHMVVYVPGLENGTFLDTTEHGIPADIAAHWFKSGTRALVLDPAGPKLVAVAYRDLPDPGVSITRDVTVRKDGVAVVRERFESRGREAGYYKSQFADMNADERRRWVTGMLSESGHPVTLITFEARGVEEIDTTFALESSYELPGTFRAEGKSVAGELPMAIERIRIGSDRTEGRVSPFRFAAWKFSSTTTVRFEDQALTIEEPSGVDQSLDSGSASVVWSKDGRELRVRVVAQDRAGIFPPDQWNAYADMTQATLAALRRPVKASPNP